MSGGILDDIDENTPRHKLYAKIRELAAEAFKKQDAKVARLQEIEEKVRKDWSGRQQDVVQLLVSSTAQEWTDAVDFLANFEELLPVALHRVHEGAKLAVESPHNEGVT